MLGRQRLGPFDVTRLAADDPTALANWLKDNGFPHPDGLDDNLAPYVADGWEIVAIQLVPAEAGGSLSGALQPLRLSFASDTVVYPMRLSRSATMSQYIDLYVLAPHRMDPSAVPVAGDKPTLEFAGPIERSDSPALADFVGDARVPDPVEEHDLRPGGDRGRLHVRAGARRYPLPASRLSHARPWTHHDLILLASIGLAGVAAAVLLIRRMMRNPSPAPSVYAQIRDRVADPLRRGPHRGDIGSGAQHVTRDRGKQLAGAGTAETPECLRASALRPNAGHQDRAAQALTSGGSASVAPTTTPIEPGPGARSRLTAAAASTIDCATVRPPASARCTPAPSGLDVAASTNTPRPLALAVSSSGCSDPKPRYGEAVTASAASGESPAQASA